MKYEILFLFFSSCYCSIIEFALTRDINYRYSTPICIGIPNQCFDLYLDFFSQYIWVGTNSTGISSDSYFDPNLSATGKPFNDNIQKEKSIHFVSQVSGNLFNDTLIFPNFQIQGLNFLLVNHATNLKNLSTFEGEIGLGIMERNRDEDFCFYRKLLKNKIIEQIVFSYKYINENTAKLLIGTVPKEIEEEFMHFGTCDLVKGEYNYTEELSTSSDKYPNSEILTRETWGCRIPSIYLIKNNGDNIYFDNKEKTIETFFDIQEEFCVVDISFLLFLETTVFRKYIDSGKCSLIRKDQWIFSFQCLESIEFDTKEIYLDFGEWNLKVPFTMDKVFKKERKKEIYDFIFVSEVPEKIVDKNEEKIVEKRREKKWILGRTLLKLFNIVFDVDNSKVGLYNKTLIKYKETANPKRPSYKTSLPEFYDPKKYRKIKKIGSFIFLFCLIVGIILLIRFFRRKALFNKDVKVESFESYTQIKN